MTLLLDQAIRSAIVVLAGLAAAGLLRGQSAALRHAVLAATIVAAAALPALTAVVPAWRISVPMPIVREAAAAKSRTAVAPLISDAARATARPSSPGRSGMPSTAGRADGASPFISVARLAQAAWLTWLAGFGICAFTLLTGFGRLAAVALRARRVGDGEWVSAADQLRAAYGIGRAVTLLQTHSPDALATFGVRHHRILLPPHADTWPPDRVHAVLSHELAHVLRHDWLVQMSAEALRCVYWFNPLMWMACARLRSESEYACDDVVLGRGVAPSDYAVHLLDLARQCRHPRRGVALSALPMARASTLERRISVMLNPAVNRTSVSSRARVAVAVLLTCFSLSVAAVRAGQAAPGTPGPQPTISHTGSGVTDAGTAPAINVVAAASTARVTVRDGGDSPAASATRLREDAGPQDPAPLAGSIYDASGAVVPGVEVKLRDAEQATSTATTDAGGRFQFPSIAAGTYALEASLPGFRTLRQSIELKVPADWNRVITLQLGQLMEKIVVTATRPAGAANDAQPQPTRIKVGGNVRPPRKLVDVKPAYPDSMRDGGREAVVSLEAVIGIDGSVTSVRVVTADIHPDFAIAAADAVRQWKFDPTLLNGVPVEVQMTVSVQFALSK